MAQSPKAGKALVRLFAAAGHVAEQIPHGFHAFEKVCDDLTAFDVIVMEHLTPGASGPLLAELLAQANYRGRIVVRSGTLTRPEIEHYRRFGVAALVRGEDRDAALLKAVTKK